MLLFLLDHRYSVLGALRSAHTAPLAVLVIRDKSLIGLGYASFRADGPAHAALRAFLRVENGLEDPPGSGPVVPCFPGPRPAPNCQGHYETPWTDV